MASGFVIRKNQYYDSVFLMGINKHLSEEEAVTQSAMLMGTEKNKELLKDIKVISEEIKSAQPNDLIVAVVAESQVFVDKALSRLDFWLTAAIENAPISNLHTLQEGLAEKPNANLAVISLPGEYAAREARKALESALNVFIFSDNVSLEDELELKKIGKQKGLLVMGPDCGTGIINGIGLGFSNSIRRGSIGIIASAGTGLQEFTSQVHNGGCGISHAIGTGSHDLSEIIGGITTLAALDALEADPQTKVIAVLSKPPASKTIETLVARFKSSKKPIIACFLGHQEKLDGEGVSFHHVRLIDEAVNLAIQLAGCEAVIKKSNKKDLIKLISREKTGFKPEQKYLRGIMAGGTYTYQTQQVLRSTGITTYSNAPLDKKYKMENPDHSRENSIVDMGDDHYTQGKPHPMIDGSERKRRILLESRDPQVAVLMVDFILGYGASMDPVGDLLNSIIEAKRNVKDRGGFLSVVANICGTNGDPQDLNLQRKMLIEAGVVVFDSNADAAQFCAELIKGR
jgi:FdrA protein